MKKGQEMIQKMMLLGLCFMISQVYGFGYRKGPKGERGPRNIVRIVKSLDYTSMTLEERTKMETQLRSYENDLENNSIEMRNYNHEIFTLIFEEKTAADKNKDYKALLKKSRDHILKMMEQKIQIRINYLNGLYKLLTPYPKILQQLKDRVALFISTPKASLQKRMNRKSNNCDSRKGSSKNNLGKKRPCVNNNNPKGPKGPKGGK